MLLSDNFIPLDVNATRAYTKENRAKRAKKPGGFMSESTFEVVRRVLVDGLSADEAAVSLETNLSEDLGADSLDAAEMIMSLEDEFDIEIEPAQAEGFKTVNDIVSYIDSVKA